MENKKEDYFQSVFIKTSDGQVHVFSGPVAFWKENKEVKIDSIKFTAPRKLPENFCFEKFTPEISVPVGNEID